MVVDAAGSGIRKLGSAVARAVTYVRPLVRAVTAPVRTVVRLVKTAAHKAVSVAHKAVSVVRKAASATAGFVKRHATGIKQLAAAVGAVAFPALAPEALAVDAPFLQQHWRGVLQTALVAGAVGLTIANVLQLGLDPVTDAAEGADVGALAAGFGEEAASTGATTVAEGGADTSESAGTDTGTSVFRTPRIGQGDSELEQGLNPANHVEGDQSAYAGTENVARDYANPKVGGYENGYVRYDMAPEFDSEFSQYKFPYVTTSGETGSEWQIPANMIDRFNELTVNRSWTPWEP